MARTGRPKIMPDDSKKSCLTRIMVHADFKEKLDNYVARHSSSIPSITIGDLARASLRKFLDKYKDLPGEAYISVRKNGAAFREKPPMPTAFTASVKKSPTPDKEDRCNIQVTLLLTPGLKTEIHAFVDKQKGTAFEVGHAELYRAAITEYIEPEEEES